MDGDCRFDGLVEGPRGVEGRFATRAVRESLRKGERERVSEQEGRLVS